MKTNIFFISFILFINHVHSNLSKEKRKELLNKYTKEVRNLKEEELFNVINLNSNIYHNKIDYDFNEIQKIINKNSFPESYNFIEKEKATIYLKDQEGCGCCWAMATTTALSYRYHKFGIKNLDLSPQYTISCLAKECRGIKTADALMNLVKSGTVTENCFKYSSGKEIVEACPNKCKNNNVEFKLYNAKNAYVISNYSKNNFYEIVELIIDQLITEGPVTASIPVYTDFSLKCTNDYIYNYDGKSIYRGPHMVVIVGYGFLNNKYYWIVQNSWGKDFCQNGFINIEFGEINIERISFASPYMPNSKSKVVEVDVKLDSLNKNSDCELKVSEVTPSDKLNWENTLEIKFENTKGTDIINYQCGVNNIINKGKIINCYYEYEPIKSEGTYVFKEFHSLGTENIFNLDGFSGKSFQYYGPQILEPFLGSIKTKEDSKSYYYVSGTGSSIIFNAEKMEACSSNPKIYADNNQLKNCKRKRIKNGSFSYYYLMICNLKWRENGYFDYTPKNMINTFLCGNIPRDTEVYVSRLDESKYPIFKVKKFTSYVLNTNNYKIFAYIVADIKGSISSYQRNNNTFATLIDFEYKEKNSDTYNTIISKIMNCKTGIPTKKVNDFSIDCEIDNKEKYIVKNLYLHNVYWITNHDCPFEILMDKDYYKVNSSPKYIKIYLILVLSIILLY